MWPNFQPHIRSRLMYLTAMVAWQSFPPLYFKHGNQGSISRVIITTGGRHLFPNARATDSFSGMMTTIVPSSQRIFLGSLHFMIDIHERYFARILSACFLCTPMAEYMSIWIPN